MTSAQERLANLHGADVYDRDGDRIGTVGQLYTDSSGQPTWASVNTGLFGLRESLVPVHQAQWHQNRLQVPYEKSTVKDAPNIDTNADEPIDDDEVARLYRHYNLSWGGGHSQETADTSSAATARDAAGSAGGDAMTRSEEQLRVGTERERVGQARLRKYVVTENVQTTVPVQREEVRVEREPITDANRRGAFSGPDLTESEHEVTLHAERPVVGTETVPVEQVRLGTETVTEEQTVGGQVRKERIEADLPGEEGTRRIG
jgi:uncharacterized protein (TIGR02271 family)